MKRIITGLILSGCIFIAGAQTNIIQDTGKVGIGTTTPGAKLELNGGAAALGTTYLNVLKVAIDGTPSYFYVDTKIPFNDQVTPQIELKGYNYGRYNKGIRLTLGWYVYAGAFHWSQYKSDLGYYNPSSIKLGTYDDNGVTRVRIQVANDGTYWSGYFFSATDKLGVASNYEGWTWSTGEMPSGTGNVVTVNEYDGIVYSNAEMVGIGTKAPAYKLDVRNYTGITGTNTVVANFDKTSNNNGGSAIIRVSTAGGGHYADIEQNEGGNGPFRVGSYADMNIVSNVLSSNPFGNINFATGSSTSPTSVVMTIGGGSQKGLVGIGTPNPSYKLDVWTADNVYNARFYQPSSSTNTYNSNVIQGANSPVTGYFGTGGATVANIHFRDAFVVGTQNNYPLNLNTNDIARVTILGSGNVGIGTSSPQSKLAVNGDIYAKKVKVTQTGWPDFVFNQEYQLKPLSEVEAFIQKYKHLPEVPSAEEVAKNDLDLGEMDKILLMKVEELTLYMIELKKENEILKSTNEALKKVNASITGRIEQIEKQIAK